MPLDGGSATARLQPADNALFTNNVMVTHRHRYQQQQQQQQQRQPDEDVGSAGKMTAADTAAAAAAAELSCIALQSSGRAFVDWQSAPLVPGRTHAVDAPPSRTHDSGIYELTALLNRCASRSLA